jgi:hypothetical protein
VFSLKNKYLRQWEWNAIYESLDWPLRFLHLSRSSLGLTVCDGLGTTAAAWATAYEMLFSALQGGSGWRVSIGGGFLDPFLVQHCCCVDELEAGCPLGRRKEYVGSEATTASIIASSPIVLQPSLFLLTRDIHFFSKLLFQLFRRSKKSLSFIAPALASTYYNQSSIMFSQIISLGLMATSAMASGAFSPVHPFGAMVPRDSLNKRQGYYPTTSYCGPGETCAESCGPTYETCPSRADLYCFDPTIGEQCCPDLSGSK